MAAKKGRSRRVYDSKQNNSETDASQCERVEAHRVWEQVVTERGVHERGIQGWLISHLRSLRAVNRMPPLPVSERSESGCGGGGRMKLWSSGVKKRTNTQRFALRHRGKYPWVYSWVNLHYAWLTADTHPWPPSLANPGARCRLAENF